jgi:resolvase, n-terminal:recombinase, putative
MSGKEKTNGSLAMAPQVITIPAASQENTRKLRVAAYARVSSNSEDQKHSFAAQNAYYSKLITDNPDWELADIYADQGITGTSIDKRDDFLRMMEDCRKGRIDRILVKSSSRFARNAKESLEAVRELAALGVSVCFEEQNIDTAQVSGEVLIAIFAALAQRESEAISKRRRWSYQVQMKKGQFNTCQAPIGYRLDGRELEVIPEEAKVVQRIFREYLSGRNSRELARMLNEENVLGLDWKYNTIDYILQNERYAGNALLQKRYTTDTLPFCLKKNRGERPQYFVEDINEAIVSQKIFDKAQALRRERRVAQGQMHNKVSQHMRCSCGSPIRAKQVRDRWYWVCCWHDERHTCPLMPIPEEEVEQAFLRLYYRLKHYGIDVLTQLISDLYAARTGSLLWSENIVEINKQISDIASQERLLTQLKQQGSVDPDIFISRGNLLAERRRELKLQKERILRSEEDHSIQQTQDMLDVLESGPDWLDDFDEQLFSDLVEKIVVVDNEKLCFRLLNGLEVTEKIERTQR